MNYMLELDYSCCRGPDPAGDKSGRGTKCPHGPFWGSLESSSFEALAGKLQLLAYRGGSSLRRRSSGDPAASTRRVGGRGIGGVLALISNQNSCQKQARNLCHFFLVLVIFLEAFWTIFSLIFRFLRDAEILMLFYGFWYQFWGPSKPQKLVFC